MLRNVRIGFSSAPVCVAIVTLIKPGNRAHVERGSSAGTEVGFGGAPASVDPTGPREPRHAAVRGRGWAVREPGCGLACAALDLGL